MIYISAAIHASLVSLWHLLTLKSETYQVGCRQTLQRNTSFNKDLTQFLWNLLKTSGKETAFFWVRNLDKHCWEKKLSPSLRRKAGVLYVAFWNSCWVSLTSDWQPKALATEIGFKLIKIWLKPSIAPKWIVANVRCFFNMYQLRPFVIPKWIHNAQWIAVCFQVKVYLG